MNYKHVVEDLARQYPSEWAAAHRGGPDTEAFVKRLAFTLHAIDQRIGLNGKRGDANDLSDDCVCVREPGQSVDARTGESVQVIDFIIGAGGPDPRPGWGEVWDPRQMPTKATWVKPSAVSGGGTGGTGGGGGGTPIEPPTNTPTGLTRADVQAMIDASIAPLPKYGDRLALRAHAGKVLCAEGGGPTEDGEAFVLTSRSGVGPWEQWTILKG
jgi:hypothetical protein